MPAESLARRDWPVSAPRRGILIDIAAPRLLIVIHPQEAPAQPAKRNAGQWNCSYVPNIPVNESADESERT